MSDFLRSEKAKHTTEAAPYILQLTALVSELEADVNVGIFSIDVSKRVEKYIRNIKTSILTIYRNVEFLRDPTRPIHDSLETIIDIFGHPHAIYRKRPLWHLRQLLSIAMVVSDLHPVVEIIVPQLAEHLPCKISDVLLEFRPLVVRARLDKIYLKARRVGVMVC